MRILNVLFSVCILAFICSAAATPTEIGHQPTPDTKEENQVIQAALQPSPLENNLHRLTDEIGGRVPGTLAMQHAVQWGVQAFTAAGADSVHTEGFSIQHSWSEGDTEMTATLGIRAIRRKSEGERCSRRFAFARFRWDGLRRWHR